MTERLLQYIWQFQYFQKTVLHTDQGEEIVIIHPGAFNLNQGPDFNNARVKIGATEWAGNVELHIKSSDWYKHNHTPDKNYHNIILHVVWHNDQQVVDGNGSTLPTLHLEPLVATVLLQRYEWLMQSQDFVPCQQQLPVLNDLGWIVWKERLAVERLHRKSLAVLNLLQQANNHWEEVFWWMLARNFGIKVNSDAFEAIAKSLPVTLLAKHKNQIHQLEALLLGQAGFLQLTFTEDYPILLQKEYNFLAKKYSLQPVKTNPFFLRMRPANFPTIRLAQLAVFIKQSTHLFSIIKETENLAEIKALLNITANDYWHYHYKFDEPGEYKPKQLGEQMTDNILINTIVPVLFAYGNHIKQTEPKDRALQWLGEITAEKNNITTAWKKFGVTCTSAVESQALIELKNNYCNIKRCLDCAVGNGLLKGK